MALLEKTLRASGKRVRNVSYKCFYREVVREAKEFRGRQEGSRYLPLRLGLEDGFWRSENESIGA